MGNEGEANAQVRRELAIRYKNFSPAWNLVKVVRRGLGSSGETVSLVEENKRVVLLLM